MHHVVNSMQIWITKDSKEESVNGTRPQVTLMHLFYLSDIVYNVIDQECTEHTIYIKYNK